MRRNRQEEDEDARHSPPPQYTHSMGRVLVWNFTEYKYTFGYLLNDTSHTTTTTNTTDDLGLVNLAYEYTSTVRTPACLMFQFRDQLHAPPHMWPLSFALSWWAVGGWTDN